ncbi:MAG: STAS domain-containing protein [Actinomycetota bacterium]
MLEYQVVEHGETVEVLLRGALADEDWTERLQAFLAEYVGDGVTSIHVNLAGVEWVDLEGVATLIRLAHQASDQGKRLVVTGAQGPVREKLELTGVADFLS